MLSKLTKKLESKLNLGSQQSAPPSQPLDLSSPASVVRYRRWSGVNLGSWFTMEKWISSRPFDACGPGVESDLDLAQSSKMGQEDKRRLLESHYDSWIVEDDFRWLRARGINTVRLPIGYYHLSGLDAGLLKGTEFEPHIAVFTGAWSRILRAIEWAGANGIGVLIDLHAAPGAQNPQDHSGTSHGIANLFSDQKNQDATSRCLTALLQATHRTWNVCGLELLNEPQPDSKLVPFQLSLLSSLRAICGPDFPLIVSDHWDLQSSASQYWRGREEDFTVLDTHFYRCFTADDGKLSSEQHTKSVSEGYSNEMGRVGSACAGRLIVGEWSGALQGPCFAGSNGGEQDAKRRAFVRAQLQLWDAQSSGFMFWTFRKQDGWDAGWSFKDACTAEIIPNFLGIKSRPGGSAPGQDEMDQRCTEALKNHSSYWNNAAKGKMMEHDRFGTGYSTGWCDALALLASPTNAPGGSASELPAPGGQAMVRRRWEHVQVRGGGEFLWEFEHGYKQGAREAKESWNRTR